MSDDIKREQQLRLSAEEKYNELHLDMMRLKKDADQKINETSALLDGLRILNQSFDKQAVFQGLLQVFQGVIAFDEAFILLLDHETGQLRPIASTHDAFSKREWSLNNFFKRAFKGNPLASFNVTMIPEWKEQLPFELPVVSALHVPVRTETQCALLVMTHPELGFFNQHHLSVAQRFIPIATQTLQNADLHSDLESKVQERTQALTNSEERVRLVIDTALDCVVSMNMRGQVIQWNRQSEITFGYSAEEANGQMMHHLIIPDEYTGAHQAGMRHYEATGEGPVLNNRIEITAKHKDGTVFPIELAITPLKLEDGTTVFSAFIRDITERKNREKALQEAKEEAEAADRAKSDFLANMSHEIRTPLNAVIGLAGLLMDTKLTAEQKDYISTIRKSGDGLLNIINDILDFSKIEAGKMTLENHPFDLRHCLEDALDLFAGVSGKKTLDLAYIIEPNTPTNLIGDITRVRQVLVNLLSNAVKFTETGEVVVTVSKADVIGEQTLLSFAVRDTGIGIPEDRMDRMFKAFSQADSTTTRKFGGTGLGLAISKQLCQMMGGDISVVSVANEGSTFTFSILVDVSDVPTMPIFEQSQPMLTQKRVLIVDDNETNRLILEKYTADWGMISTSADSGQSALLVLDENPDFDVAIVDVHMPQMDGLTLTRILKRAYPNLPIVILSSSGRNELNAGELPIFSYLMKPIKPRLMLDTLNSLFSTKTEDVATTKTRDMSIFDEELAHRHPLRILVAEDNTVNQKVITHTLEKFGYRADIANNGIEVLESLARQQYDLVLMDIQMPEMDGLTATKEINALYGDSRPHIIALTAYALQGNREQFMSQGMDDYLTKPIRFGELKTALEKVPAVATIPTITPSPIDLVLIEQQMGMVDDELVAELLDLFLTDIPKHLTRIEQGIVAQDATIVHKSAHAVKGAGISIGATQVVKFASSLEEMGKAAELLNARAILAHLHLAVKQVERYANDKK